MARPPPPYKLGRRLRAIPSDVRFGASIWTFLFCALSYLILWAIDDGSAPRSFDPDATAIGTLTSVEPTGLSINGRYVSAYYARFLTPDAKERFVTSYGQTFRSVGDAVAVEYASAYPTTHARIIGERSRALPEGLYVVLTWAPLALGIISLLFSVFAALRRVQSTVTTSDAFFAFTGFLFRDYRIFAGFLLSVLTGIGLFVISSLNITRSDEPNPLFFRPNAIAAARVTRVERLSSKHNGQNLNVVHAEFTDDSGTTHDITSYITSYRTDVFEAGELVEVEYERDTPQFARVVGTTFSSIPRWLLLLLQILFGLSVLLFVYGVVVSRRRRMTKPQVPIAWPTDPG